MKSCGAGHVLSLAGLDHNATQPIESTGYSDGEGTSQSGGTHSKGPSQSLTHLPARPVEAPRIATGKVETSKNRGLAMQGAPGVTGSLGALPRAAEPQRRTGSFSCHLAA